MILKKSEGITLFTKFKRKTKTLFLDPKNTQVPPLQKGEKYAVILSPSLYWIKKVELPVKYLHEVKKLLPSLFEDTLKEGVFHYSAYKADENEYYLFAYEDKKILAVLEEFGIDLHTVSGIYFTQMEFESSHKIYRINDEQVIYKKDGVFVVAPSKWFEHIEPLRLEDHHIVSKGIQLQQYGHIVDSRSLRVMMLMALILLIVMGVELFITKQKIAQVADDKSALFAKYALKPTMMQNKAILSSYQQIYDKQVRVREVSTLLLKAPLQSQQLLESIQYKNGVIKADFSGIKIEQSGAIKKFLQKHQLDFNVKQRQDGIRVEVKL